jgi:hypothetical protein
MKNSVYLNLSSKIENFSFEEFGKTLYYLNIVKQGVKIGGNTFNWREVPGNHSSAEHYRKCESYRFDSEDITIFLSMHGKNKGSKSTLESLELNAYSSSMDKSQEFLKGLVEYLKIEE